jgi:hypothetical protein
MTNKEKIDATVALGAALGWVPIKNGKAISASRCHNNQVVDGKKVCGGMTAIPFYHKITGAITAKCFACGTRS